MMSMELIYHLIVSLSWVVTYHNSKSAFTENIRQNNTPQHHNILRVRSDIIHIF